MSGLSEYVLSISVAAIICALIVKLLPEKGASVKMGKILCGMFLMFSILRPLTDINLLEWNDLSSSIRQDAEQVADEGKMLAKNQWEYIITERIRAYILDEAAKYDAVLTVSVQLSQDTIPIPVGVQISGNISPYGKQQLKAIIDEDLGIAEEAQIWS